MMRNILCLGGLILSCAPAVAAAQDKPGDEATARDANEIIVTAQRRAERLVDVPISVNSVSQEDLELKKINSILDLSKAVTSLRFEGHTPAFQPTLRGVGSQVQGAGVDSNVAVYIDGFYLSNNYGMGFDLPNVENVQILKGPQGTLFGRNATGGAILVTTAEPSFEATARLKLKYTAFNDVTASGYISGPLSSNVAAGLSVYFRKGDGYTKNIVTGADDDAAVKQFSIRPDILFTNHDNLKLRLIYEHNYNSTALGLAASYPDDYNIFGALGVPVGRKASETAENVLPFNQSKGDAIYALAEWNLNDDVTLKSNTGYRHDHLYFQTEGDFSPLDLLWVSAVTDNKTFSQEFVLSGESGRVDWVAGVNYYYNLGKEPDSGIVQGTVRTTLKSQTVKTNAIAAFADVTIEAGDGFFLTAGGRYSTEKKVSDTIFFGAPQPTESERWNKFTPRAVVRYQIENNTNVYASYSKGFRSGAYTGFPPEKVNPETLDAFEVGFKHASPVFDLNAAAFFYNYKDAQVTIIDLNGLGRTLNAGNQHNYGAEIELAIRPVPEWSVNLAGAYLRAKYTDFEGAAAAVPVDVQLAPGFFVPGGWGQVSRDASGTYAPRSPKWTGNIASTYDIDLGAGTIQLAGNVSLTSHFFHFTNEGFREPGYAKVDLNISYTTEDKHWRGELFVTNLTNHHSAAERIGGPFGTLALYTPPRVFGGSISYSF
jgi:iron complex outermembrane receptor protein